MNTRTHIAGNLLNPCDQERVLRAFAHRFTRDHKPAWANKPLSSGKFCRVQFASDTEWLANTQFAIRKSDGRLDMRVKACISHPTWPEGSEPQ